jgi:hypothetical protein
MLQALLKDIQEKIQTQMQAKFGLNSDQTSQSASILLENFKKFFSEDMLSGNLSNLKSMLDNGLQNISTNPALQDFQKKIMEDLIAKVGLPEDLAAKVKDFQINELFSSIQNEFLGADGKPDLSKILGKINVSELQEKAKDLLGGLDLGSLFGKK